MTGLLGTLLQSVLLGVGVVLLGWWFNSASAGSGQPTASAATPKKKARKKKKEPEPAAGTSAAAAPARKAPQAAAAAPKPSLPPPPESSSSESEEEESFEVVPRMKGYAGGSFETLGEAAPGAWEPVGKKKPAQRAGKSYRAAATSSGAARGGKANAAQQTKKGPVRTCERPDCGASGTTGFKKCGRCHAVFYCTPGCLMSDWERHQLNCDLD